LRLSGPLRTVRATFTAHSSSLRRRSSRSAAVPSQRGSPVPRNGTGVGTRPLTSLRLETCGYCLVTTGGRSRRPANRKAPAEAQRASVPCLEPLSQYLLGADEPCGQEPHRRAFQPPTYLLAPLIGWPQLSCDGRPSGSLPPFGWGDVASRLNPYPPHYRTAFAFSLLLYPQPHRLASRFAFPRSTFRGGLRAYHVSYQYRSGLGRASQPVARHLRQRNAEPLHLATSLLGQAYQHLPHPCLACRTSRPLQHFTLR